MMSDLISSMDLIHNGAVYHPTNSLPLSVQPGEKLSVKLSLQTNDSHLQVFARNCKATPTSNQQGTQQYLVLDNGYVVNQTLFVQGHAHTTYGTQQYLVLDNVYVVNQTLFVQGHAHLTGYSAVHGTG